MYAELYEFKDHRLFLKSVLSHQSDMPSFMERCAKAFGISRSQLSLILKGERKLSSPLIHRIARVLHFPPTLQDYWEALVRLNQASGEEERQYYQSRIGILQKQRSSRGVISSKKSIIAKWYVPAVLIYIWEKGYSPDQVDHISRQLGVSKAEITATISELEAEGVLTWDAASTMHISFNRVGGMVSQKQFIKKNLEVSKVYLDRLFDEPKAFFDCTTLSLADDDIRQFIKEYKILLDKMMQHCAEGNKNVSQISLQFYPVIT